MTTRRSRREDKQTKLQFTEEEVPNEIFEDESSEFKISVKKAKKPKNKSRSYCDLCGKNGPKLHCESHCDLNFHTACLESQVEQEESEIKSYLASIGKEFKDKLVAIYASICLYCTYRIARCFKCKKLGEIDTSQKKGKPIEDTGKLLKCKKCPRFLHYNCFVQETGKELDGLVCNSHFCSICSEYSDKLNVCIKCPIGFHRKCMSKRNKIVKGNRIICQLHSGAKDKVKKITDDMNIYKYALKTKRSQISEPSLESQGKKKIKTETLSHIVSQDNVS